jgi:soluble lytic murein transglycosylase
LARAVARQRRTRGVHSDLSPAYSERRRQPYAAYYAAWSQALLGMPRRARCRSLDDGESVTVPSRSEPVPPAGLSPFHVERWRELRLAGIDELMRGELVAIEAGSGDDGAAVRFLVGAYQDADDFRRARALVERPARRRACRRANGELLYPLGFWEEVRQSLEANRSIWVVALVRQESMFDRMRISGRRLMQLLPSTAKRVAGVDGELDLSQPQLNIDLGTTYLRTLIDRFDGDILKALAAYNGGEGAVDRWQQQFGALAPDEFVESITYRETRDYVKRVAGNYRVYRDIYIAEDGSS